MKINFFNNKVFTLLSCGFLLTACSIDGKHFTADKYMTDLNYRENSNFFRILQFDDLHLSSARNLDEDYNFLTYMITEAKKEGPVDLVIFAGDVFTFASKATVVKSFKEFDSWGIPWTVAWGNHDEQTFGSYTMPSELANDHKTFKNSVFKYLKDDMTGLSNNVYNIKDKGVTKYQVFAIDSNTYSNLGYDYVHEDQIDWYKECIELENKKLNPNYQLGDSDVIPSIIFQHIPLPEYKEALNDKTIEESGKLNEEPCPPDYNSGFYDVIRDCKSTKVVSVAHDHINNFDYVTKDGIHLMYGYKSTNNIYRDDNMLGYREFKLNKDGSFETFLKSYKYGDVK